VRAELFLWDKVVFAHEGEEGHRIDVRKLNMADSKIESGIALEGSCVMVRLAD
jgi:hypothetical protein